MRILLVSFEYPPRIVGGLGTYAQNLVRGLRKKGVDVDVIVPVSVRTESALHAIASRIAYFGLHFSTKKAMNIVNGLNRSERFDLVHFNGPYPIIRPPKASTICTFHSLYWELTELTVRYGLKRLRSPLDVLEFVLRNPIACLNDVIMAQIVDKIICPSENLVKALRSYCFVNDHKIHVVPNGFDVEEFDKISLSDTALLDKYNLEKDGFLLYMGRLSPLKGVEYLIKAFKCVKRDCKNLKLIIAGSGGHEFHLRNVVGDTKDIVFTGFLRSDRIKKTLYSNSLAIVLPSLMESFPLMVLEAMACNKPVIASNVGGICSMVRHGKNGFLIPPKDIEGLSRFVRFLYENRDLSKKMGLFGRELLEREFTVDVMVTKTLEVYRSVCERSE